MRNVVLFAIVVVSSKAEKTKRDDLEGMDDLVVVEEIDVDAIVELTCVDVHEVLVMAHHYVNVVLAKPV